MTEKINHEIQDIPEMLSLIRLVEQNPSMDFAPIPVPYGHKPVVELSVSDTNQKED